MSTTPDDQKPSGVKLPSVPSGREKTALATLNDEDSALTPEVVRSEVNFLVLPFFALWDKDVKQRTKTECKVIIKKGQQKLEVSWTVVATSLGYPGPFDKRVHKAIEQIINELPRPVQNPIPLGSFYNLCKRMELKTRGGQIYREIKESLQKIVFTGIISKGAFYSKEKESWIEDSFHLYDRLITTGEKLLNGEIADTNYLYLNSWYLENINANYVKPLDWQYYTFLKTPLAQRLYELLGVKFYGVITRQDRKLSYKYSTLCALLPAARQKYLSWARRILDPSHEKLKKTGFLADYRWDETSPQTKGDWLITYYPGKRARDEVRKAKTYFKSPQLEFESLPAPETETLELEKEDELLTQEQAELLEKLVELNVTKSVADDLVRHFDTEIIQRWIEAIYYVDARDKAAYLVDAIRRDWLLPAKWLRAKEQEQEKTKFAKLKQLEEERQQEEERKKRAEAKQLDKIYRSLSVDQRQEVDEEAEKRISFIARDWIMQGKTDSPIVQAERKSKREEVLKEWLKSGKIEGP